MTDLCLVSGIRELAERYHTFIVDQWGVLHDGMAPLPDARDALGELGARGKQIIVASNTGRRAQASLAMLGALGFDTSSIAAIVTSGEVTWQELRERRRAPFDRLGRRCLLVTHDDGDTGLAGAGVEVVDDVRAADFLLVAGFAVPPETIDAYRAVAEAACALRLPMVCSNPDLVAPYGRELRCAPGALGALYEGMGGFVTYVGKPERWLYDACLAVACPTAVRDVVVVGDSLKHDVEGAARAGLDSCLITSGVHRDELPPDLSAPQLVSRAAAIAARHHVHPTWVCRRFRW